MQKSEAHLSRRPIPLSFILMAVLLVHLPLLLMKLPLKSYDTNLHIFFASHYLTTGLTRGIRSGMRAFPKQLIRPCRSSGLR